MKLENKNPLIQHRKSFRYILAFGSNIDPKKIHCINAMLMLNKWGVFIAKSPDLITAPLQSKVFDTGAQAQYLNFIADFATHLHPQSLYDKIYSIEDQIGHNRKKRWQSREIDIDILYWFHNNKKRVIQNQNISFSNKNLKIPHLEIENREFISQLLNSLISFSTKSFSGSDRSVR